jgi:hypothetical protein
MLQAKRIDSIDRGNDNATGGIINKSKKMGDPVKFGQFLIQILLFLAGMAGMYMTLSEKVETQRVEIEYLKGADKDKAVLIKDLYQQQSQQFNEINSKLTDILIKLENKENKK